MSDDDFLLALERCTLPASDWTHEAHVRFAWLTLSRLSYTDAIDHIRLTIQQYNANVLKKERAYHETITLVFTHLIAKARSALKEEHQLADLKRTYPALFDSKLPALLRHYRRETLFSDSARNGFVEPDLIPLPALQQ